ncbi:hypothetical protein MNBD_GAMMA06-1843 [hydrothermal vent metagenome]|uniref:Outer membrane protein beta-barrel domain-containing protein n=1 Tax=hydrothermal vent metagenome TaxID=652676 RepID=A0A3B0W4B5_9ZZZZ
MIKPSSYRIFGTVILLLFAKNIMAEDISFDYVQASYFSDTIALDGDVSEMDGTGIGFLLSLGFSSAFAMTLAVDSTTFSSFQDISVDTSKRTALGITAHTSVVSKTDIFANLSVIKAEITATDGVDSRSESDFGGVIKMGVRHLVTDDFELELNTSYMSVFSATVNSYAVDTRFYLRKRWSLGVGYFVNDDQETISLNLRVSL